MKILVTYESKTGFTKKYAEWIAADLNCELEELSKVKVSEIAGYDLVIHGGWIMGGMVNGLNKVREYNLKKVIVFGVGFTAKSETDIDKLIETNKLEDIQFYYYEGGMDPSKMGFMGRTMVKMVTKKKPEYSDHTNKEEINELVNAVKEINA